MEGNKRNLIIIAAIVLVAALFFFRGTSHNKVVAQQPPAAVPEKMDKKAPVEPLKTFSSSAEVVARREQAVAQRKAILRMQASGFASLAMADVLHYRTNAIERRCKSGDLDIIKEDLKILGLPEGNLAFTIETLSSPNDETPLQKQTVSLGQLKANMSGQFNLKRTAKPQILGLFLCSFKGDLKELKRVCADLKPENIGSLAEIQSDMITQPKNEVSYKRTPKIYFFQMLVVGPRGIYIYENKPNLEIDRERMNQALGVSEYPYLNRDITRGIELMRAVGSMTPMVTSSEITLNLPHRGNCPIVPVKYTR